MNRIYFLLLFLPTILFAQENNSTDSVVISKHEINVGITRVFNRNNVLLNNPTFQYDEFGNITGQYFSEIGSLSGVGIGYKFHHKGVNAIRISVLFAHSNNTTDQNQSSQNSSYLNKTDLTSLEGRMGYEFGFDLKRVHFYFGPEFILGVLSYKSTSENELINPTQFVDPNTGLPVQQIIRQMNSSEGNTTSFGGSFFLGIRYYVVPALSIGFETKLDALVHNQTQKHSSESIGVFAPYQPRTYETKSNGFSFIPNPIGLLSINIHF